MAGFVQIIEMKTSRYDEVDKLTDEWRAQTQGRRATGRAMVTKDRDKPNTYVVVVEFPSYEAAMKNNDLPETAQFAEKMKRGPVVVMTVFPSGPQPLGKRLVSWFLYSVVVGLFAAYIAGHALPAGASFRQVLRFAGVTAFVGYALALWQMSIWYGRAWLATIKATIDSVIYALVTAAILGWMWPHP